MSASGGPRSGGTVETTPISDALHLAELIRGAELSPREAVEDAIARIEKLEPLLNALTSTVFDEALAQADSPNLPDGPFKGVPLLLKDLGYHQAGLPVYEGNGVLKEMNFKTPADSPFGARLRQAGFIVLGKTATPEFGAQPTAQALAFGPTRNPWDTERSTCGSSGGSGAAVASGMVTIAHASDGGGSIRQPASWCGLVGLKPTRGRIPRPAAISRLGTELCVSWTVRDSAAMLDVTHGHTHADLYQADPPVGPYLDETQHAPGQLRIGVMTTVDHPAVQIDERCQQAARAAGELLASLGHQVEESGPRGLFDEGFLHNAELDYGASMLASVTGLWRGLGRELDETQVEPYTWARISRAKDIKAVDAVLARSWLQAYTGRMLAWWDSGFDLLLTPTTGRPAALLTELEVPQDDPWSIDLERFAQIRCFVRPFNVTGQPAISLPLSMTADGLPIGVQLVSAMGREDLLIRVAAQLEEAQPWIQRRPAVFAS